ncbi:AraC family transcriptional regulator [Alteromonas sp. 38]|uniref:helix-turn-helix transcriptional regulator n=1 Tax=Alteromonas TaxID=226 RepID=UPI0012EFDF12|nr:MULTISPECIES: helix-turn-helix transcriptional regulator [Alteromonas]CAD5264894.1 AraC family transcriptional regulator [Alteromonas sp. 154]VXC13671.1 AraC family transcriptional regulator [Alteromonas sp. 38]
MKASGANESERKIRFMLKFEQQLSCEMDRRASSHDICDIRVSDMANALNMDVSTLRRLCQKHYGKSPKACIDRLRIAEARKLLLVGERPSSIADKLGFYEHKTFSALFKKYEGVSPLIYTQNDNTKALGAYR